MKPARRWRFRWFLPALLACILSCQTRESEPALDGLKALRSVLKPGGSVLIQDKFLKAGESAPLRRMLNLLSRHLVTRLDVVFEEVLAAVPELKIASDMPVLAGGWFRSIHLTKAG